MKSLKALTPNSTKVTLYVSSVLQVQGKSTFLRTLNLLETVTSGKVVVDGYELSDPKTDLTKPAKISGWSSNISTSSHHMTVLENVTFAPVELGRMNKEEADKLAMDLLDRVGLADKADAMPDSLSGWTKTTWAIARGLAMNPDIMLFDEPTSALTLKWSETFLTL